MNSNTIFLIIATLIVAAGAYWYFFTGTGNQPPLTVSATSNEAQMQFQTLVGELRSISFPTAVFDNPQFMALVDLTTPIQPEASGRPDPFAPVSVAAGT